MAAPGKAKRSNKFVYMVVLAGAVIIAAIFLCLRKPIPGPQNPTALPATFHSTSQATDASVFVAYGGSESCKSCHETEYQLWRGSHHGLAERPIDSTLDAAAFSKQAKIVHGSQASEVAASNGNFQITTAALDGKQTVFTPQRVIGVDPLRQ